MPRPIAMMATMPSMRSVDLSFAGLRLPAGSWATATLDQRVSALDFWREDKAVGIVGVAPAGVAVLQLQLVSLQLDQLGARIDGPGAQMPDVAEPLATTSRPSQSH
jgi:hypothetical protein